MLRAADTIAKTDTGRQRRANEDMAYARPPVFVVADGMGGAQAGEVASRIAVEAFEHGLPATGSFEQRLAQVAHEANRQIFELANAERDRAGMGTTLTAACLHDSELAIAHVGDSRAYLFRDRALKRLTQDHSLVDELVRRGKLTEEEAAEHPQRSIITRALGPEPDVDVDTWSYPMRDGDLVLLCSDGLTSMVAEERMAEILQGADSLDQAAQALIDAANQAGGRDNITVILVRLEEVEAGPDGGGDPATVIAAPAAEGEDRTSATAVHPAVVDARPRTRPAPARPRPQSAPASAGRHPEALRDDATIARPLRVRRRRHWRQSRVAAALVAALVVLCLIIGGGYLATRQLYFIGTNAQGLVTIYRGLPYVLPGGIDLYETFYVSGVPASVVPADRRGALLNNTLRSQSGAAQVVRDLELGRITQ